MGYLLGRFSVLVYLYLGLSRGKLAQALTFRRGLVVRRWGAQSPRGCVAEEENQFRALRA